MEENDIGVDVGAHHGEGFTAGGVGVVATVSLGKLVTWWPGEASSGWSHLATIPLDAGPDPQVWRSSGLRDFGGGSSCKVRGYDDGEKGRRR